jgi:hypothetical protein
MGIFSKLDTSNDIQSDGDSIGTGRILETGLYNCVIEAAYVSIATSGAMAINFNFKTKEQKELRQNVYVTSGDSKGNLNYYVDKSGNKKYLPGFTIVNDICLLSTGQELSELDTEEKVLSIWNPELKKEAPTKCQVIMDLVGKEITLAIIKVIEPKRVKNAAGEYVDTTETRTFNEISKAFRHEDMKTVTEIVEEKEATFHEKWLEVNAGKDRVKAAKNPIAAPGGSTEPAKPTKKLFGK